MPVADTFSDVETNLRCTIASGDVLDVRHFSVHEKISSLFVVQLVVMSKNHNIDFDQVVGSAARFTMHHNAHERYWDGICSSLEQVAVGEAQGLSTYQLTIAPSLWLATQRRNYRMFQQKSELDCVKELLEEWEIKPEERLTSTYKKRKYRVQYGESDYAFICRMLEDAGISFYFSQSKGKTQMVLSDAPQMSEPRKDVLPFHEEVSTIKGEYVTNVRIGQRVRSGRYTMRDHDYRLPADYKLLASAEGARVEVEKRLERFHYTPGAFLFGSDKGESTPSADDRGKTRTDEAEAKVVAQKRLEAKRSNAKVCAFETNVPDIAPGMVVQFEGHPRDDLRKNLLVVEANHTGTSYGEWKHFCEARSAEQPYRPPLSTPKPKVSGVESATVVGPPGEEIHCDEFGRVRVHFHWDRESAMDDKSSCWIHVSQPWAGGSFGGTNLPRVGQEVIVDFLGGDPDRPIIIGRVYTNLKKVPYKLPENKTQSGWKSESSPGGGGFNELRFEDKKGKELVYMQAEKDLKRLTKNNEDITVGNNLTKLVANNEREVTGQNRSISVGVNRAAQIGSIDSTMVGDTHVIMISPPSEGGAAKSTSWTMKKKKIVLDTGAGAKIEMDGSSIRITAKDVSVVAWNSFNVLACNQASVGGMQKLTLSSPGGDVVIKGGPMVKINPG
ncbi:MAG: type VI secretion system tip protein VgrG [Polyangiaceae bacterium]|nr:type VI secretion system tip protein VgrG [Polyangiaceae bacterium]